VVAAVEVRGEPNEISGFRGTGRIRLARVPNTQIATLTDLAETTVAAGATIITDANNGYNGLLRSPMSYGHDV
jgi:hypothetical protein